METQWNVRVLKAAQKEVDKMLPRIQKKWTRLLQNLKETGPVQTGWKNFKKDARVKGQAKTENRWHCHIHSGQPTYVVRWKQNTDESISIIEVYDAGTHEKFNKK